jgi:Leucine-rich repeat (LRR) protein
LIEIDGKIFQNLNHLNRLDVSDNSISILRYSGLHRLTHLNIDNNNLREVPNFCSENGSSFAHHLRKLFIVNNKVQVLKTKDFQCAVKIKTLHISKNPLKEIQINVFAPLSKLSNLIIHIYAKVSKYISR